jgi:Raf kinase inhibitor-like YbhB/YbcL family protein
MTIVVSSPAFSDGDEIPQAFTCEGADVSPPLVFAGIPENTAELALLVEDPDAPGGTFTHWVMWGINPGRSSLGEGEVPAGAVQGTNDFGRLGYGGPCPPPGPPHRYVFTVFALSEPLDLPAGASAADLKRAMAGTVLDSGQLTGWYQRR